MKAVALISGGLDSALGAKVVMEQGVEVYGFTVVHVFSESIKTVASSYAERSADELGIILYSHKASRDFLNIVKHPRYGYGKNMNPCLDCRIYMLIKAGQYMKKIGASFLITGEVLGERPMSQRRDAMNIVDRDSGLKGLILRPLSAKLLSPTIPEIKGWISRDRLLDIQGRSRKPQFMLANQYGIREFSAPAGGCLLTEPNFSKRMKDLIKFKPDFMLKDVELLKIGRHFRLPSGTKVIIGRNEQENNKLLKLAGDKMIHLEPQNVPGPVVLVESNINDEDIRTAALLCSMYCKKTAVWKHINVFKKGHQQTIRLGQEEHVSDKDIKEWRV
ncbi:MAG: tRNA 4-thiouridine(8) synthase ThiI [bacterium]|nr:tRNA 4-thiouridine(8) synthase ThiI [bacterium]